jgi:hypothetical protein
MRATIILAISENNKKFLKQRLKGSQHALKIFNIKKRLVVKYRMSSLSLAKENYITFSDWIDFEG